MCIKEKNFNRGLVKKRKNANLVIKIGRHEGGPSNRVSRETFGEESPRG